MPWYVWVWGVVSTLGTLCLIALCAEVIYDLIQRRKPMGRKVADLERRNAQLRAELSEIRKGQNEWGKITP